MSPWAMAKRQRLCGVSTGFGIGDLVEDGTVWIQSPPAECGGEVQRTKKKQHMIPVSSFLNDGADNDRKRQRAEIAKHVHGGKQRCHMAATHVDGNRVTRWPGGADEECADADEGDGQPRILHEIRPRPSRGSHQHRHDGHPLALGRAASRAPENGINDTATHKAAKEQGDLCEHG